MSAPVLITVAAGVAQITLNRPEKRNALDRATIAALSSELQRCAGDAAVRVVQITGAGQAFCAGADLIEMQAQADDSQANLVKDGLKQIREAHAAEKGVLIGGLIVGPLALLLAAYLFYSYLNRRSLSVQGDTEALVSSGTTN